MMLVTFMAPVWCDASLLELLESKHGMREGSALRSGTVVQFLVVHLLKAEFLVLLRGSASGSSCRRLSLGVSLPFNC